MSERQYNLFWAALEKVAETTGSEIPEVMNLLHPIRITIHTEDGIIYKPFTEYTTYEFSEFIDKALDRLATAFNLQIDITKSKPIVYAKQS